jgi:hypothetical protein
MKKAHVVVDNKDGSIVAVFFNVLEVKEYLNFMSDKYGQMVDTDPETYRFVWEDLEDYSRNFIKPFIG